ncbi:MAG: RNA polymerase sigma factor [Inquilinus sp.]|nr:RNA polymerase sigma factor [Inquilinus sp.]
MTPLDDAGLVDRAQAGDRAAFETLVDRNRRPLRAVVRRLVGVPEDTDDLVQETLLRAWQGFSGFRGESAFGTWLCAVGTRLALDHLRRQRRWRVDAQVVYGNECYADEAMKAEVVGAIGSPDFMFEAREHIAYCLTCVGRSLPPEQHAALTLRDMAGMSNREAAAALGVTQSVLRHHLARAREAMTQAFEGLCSLVNKQGVCYQCKGLREATPEPRRGPPIPAIDLFLRRIEVARGADIDAGASQAMHDLFWRRTAVQEAAGSGTDTPAALCGQEDGA